MLKVKELIEQLQQLDPELPVMSQSDPEGNGYAPLAGVDVAVYQQDGYNIEVYHPDDVQDLLDEEYITGTELVKKCAIVWPAY